MRFIIATLMTNLILALLIADAIAGDKLVSPP